ncbi:MAG TPA: TatD family hydrolase [Clostridiales bacterium]|nr:TatD family hydrolase [Clostridiales bacterium]HQP69700.1 TatD family hydrolase [Clostridiales bacterium]
MKIIDSHFHFSKIASFQKAAELNGNDYSRAGFMKEAEQNGVVSAVCMGISEFEPGSFPDVHTETPMTYDIDFLPDDSYFCAGINPHMLDQINLMHLEKTLTRHDCAGIKIYAGYYYYTVTSPIYKKVYELAMKYDLPVVIHSGDTFSDRGLLRYSHPLYIDELAVRYPDLRIVICHLGNPWVMDAAEIVYKNKNVYSDLSGLQVGTKEVFGRFSSSELWLNTFRTAMVFADRYDKFLYGSDWPLAPMKSYIDLIKVMVPEEHHEKVFYDNALNVFKKLRV